LIRKTGSVETIIQQITNGTNTGSNTAYILTTITQCSVGDEVYGYVDSGSLRLNPFNLSSPTNFTSFSGSRISN
jgi:dihydroxyacetone kinase DhaKLM complex PTS-EIIA-like component DhaM